jgi:hypothetical protein
MFNERFKWKLIENKLKADKDKGKLGEEKYQVVVFAIFGLVLSLAEVAGIINIKAANVFIEDEPTKNNLTSAILAETLLFLNYCRLHRKDVMRCCVPLLFIIEKHSGENITNNLE